LFTVHEFVIVINIFGAYGSSTWMLEFNFEILMLCFFVII